MLENAIALARQGFHVFPLKPGTKRPAFKAWESLASADPELITRWWTAMPNANIGIACGPSNLLVIDLDKAKKPGRPEHGQQTLTALAAGRELPSTLTVASARGGRHLYFRQPEGAALRNTAGSATAGLGPLIDTRGHGGFIVAPGSIFEGGSYLVENQAPVASLPSWIVDELTKPRVAVEPAPAPMPRTPVTDRRRSAYANTALNRSADTVAMAPEGTRNDTLNRESFRMGRLVGGGVLQRDDVEGELRRAAQHSGLPPGEAANTIASGLSAGTNHPRSIPDRDPLPRARQQPKDNNVMTPTPDNGPAAADEPSTPPSKHVGASPNDTPERSTGMPQDNMADAGESKARPVTGMPASPVESAQPPQTINVPDHATDLGDEAEDIWNDLRASFDHAHQVLAKWTSGDETDELKPALDEASRLIAQKVTTRGVPTAAESRTVAPAPTNEPESAAFIEPVDAAYTEAQVAGISTDSLEWTGIGAIRDAIHNLWDTIKAVAGTYWAELSADMRVMGPLKSLAARSARGIANLAGRAANRLEQRGVQQAPSVESLAGLREAYINARSRVRAHAATYEWQRISALWGTVSTLARQADDPGIRAVVARSADAISDHADALSRRAAQDVQAGAANALDALAGAAESHASALRASADNQASGAERSSAAATAVSGGATSTPRSPQQGEETGVLQARAHEVARLAQARLGQVTRTNAAPRSPRSANGSRHHQGTSAKYMPPVHSPESSRGMRP